jgi:hypothetical protein
LGNKLFAREPLLAYRLIDKDINLLTHEKRHSARLNSEDRLEYTSVGSFRAVTRQGLFRQHVRFEPGECEIDPLLAVSGESGNVRAKRSNFCCSLI